MHYIGRTRATTRSLRALLASTLLLASSLAQAQNFEAFYGEATSVDSGADVKSVNVCPGKGSITVGTRDELGLEDILVTRVDSVSKTQWQNSYHIVGGNRAVGNAIVELRTGRGFVITGAVQTSRRDQYIYVLHIDCDGQPVWTTLLDNLESGHRATGYDVIESVGDHTAGSNELVVVGEENSSNDGRTHGRITRLDPAGNQLWGQYYSGNDTWPDLAFRAVTENVSAAGTSNDLVVGGNSISADGTSGALMFRTDGGGNPVCHAILNNAGKSSAQFHGVAALRSKKFRGESALVGIDSNLERVEERAYLARFAAGSCNVLAQSLWSDPKTDAIGAYDVTEAIDFEGGPGALIVAATSGSGALGSTLIAKIGPLTQYTPQMNYFGSGKESLVSIDRLSTDRVVLAGATFNDRDGVGDTADIYLVQTDPAYGTQCVKKWTPKVFAAKFEPQQFAPKVGRLDVSIPLDVQVFGRRDEGLACDVDPPAHCPGVINNGIVQLGVSNTGFLNVECPAIGPSSGVNGGSLVGLRYMPTKGDAASPGSPCEGWGVASADLGVSGHTSRCHGTFNMVAAAPVFTPATALTTVDVGGMFRVVHNFTPVPATPYLYRVDVSIRNIGSQTVGDLRYTRGIDYDVPPNTFSEYVTLEGDSPFVVGWNNNGFNSLDPLVLDSGTTGPFDDLGPGDLGTHIDLQFGSLAPGQTRSFVTYYGAAPTERHALNALATVGASVYSLGQSNWDGTGDPLDTVPDPVGSYGRDFGGPATFMYGFDSKALE